MDSEVIAALIATPAVLVTAATAWMAGRVQSRGAYHGPVDAVRRTAQREAYADLYRTARYFLDAFETAENAVATRQPFESAVDEMHTALDALEHAASMVELEGPDPLADIANRVYGNARRLAGHRISATVRTWTLNPNTPQELALRNEAMTELRNALNELLPTARRYLNGGPLQ
ncbi:hypothetical protein [Streptomyces sp. CL12-4]|uniref:hypothetical protein n=1 Tax=Streptomyces sp. CL12-4 TaxID=2810306 RepID=UPI001EFC0FE3|nr:hypothetical protein [Streptomyces sp. CL12-4]MCG8971811.1 hypothetical protein [Streptomyces sp. CL12-4]